VDALEFKSSRVPSPDITILEHLAVTCYRLVVGVKLNYIYLERRQTLKHHNVLITLSASL
jgi:hypothetical protein